MICQGKGIRILTNYLLILKLYCEMNKFHIKWTKSFFCYLIIIPSFLLKIFAFDATSNKNIIKKSQLNASKQQLKPLDKAFCFMCKTCYVTCYLSQTKNLPNSYKLPLHFNVTYIILLLHKYLNPKNCIKWRENSRNSV